MGEKEGLPAVNPTIPSSVPASSPAQSDVSALIEKENASIACSPAPSNCSLLSEQEQTDGSFNSRQSPFLTISQPSPSSSFLSLPRPEYLNAIPDSETSSRSSMDGIAPTGRHEYRSRKRKNSSDSSSSEESIRTTGDEIEQISSRKSSKTRLNEDGNLIVPGRGADAPRGRIANIRRESNCSVDNEAANEKHVRAAQMVSDGFDNLMNISSTVPPSPRRIPSNQGVDGSLSIVTNPFLPTSCSPSPTRISDKVKQCYSPSTQQIVRANAPYSPSPSPTQSPTRQRLLRSLSPICTKSALAKRRYTAGNGDDIDAKRQFTRTSTSPLVTERSFPYPSSSVGPIEFVHPPLPAGVHTGILSRKPVQLIERERTPDFPRRTSMDSFSDDQKSVRDDISEPSSITQSEELMDMDESTGTSRNEEDNSQDAQKMTDALEESRNIPLPDDEAIL